MPDSKCSGSDNSDTMSEDHSSMDKGDDICRDYLRNVCKRGKRCKYRHPDEREAREYGRSQEYTFCHDYQNSGCRRSNCKFIHCTREEEEYHKQTGQLPVKMQQAAALGIGVAPRQLPLLKGEVPICKDFLKGECKRSTRCKFRHLTGSEYDFELRRTTEHRTVVAVTPVMERYDAYSDDVYEYDHTAKRKRIELDDYSSSQLDIYRMMRPVSDYRLVEDENMLLRRKVEELKKQVNDLAAMNEVLLEQNARYRVSKVAAAITTGPAMVSVVTPTITPAPAVASAPINPLTTNLPQISLTSTSDLVSQQTLQPRLAPELASQAAINTPVSIAPPPSGTIQTIMPASLAPSAAQNLTVSLAPGGAQNLAPSCSVTLPTLPTASIPQATIPQNLLTVTTTPILSFPLMSQASHASLPNNIVTTTPILSFPAMSQASRTILPNNSMAH